MSYIGNSPGVASQRVVTTFTATNGQTTFTPTSGYTLGYCDVYFNGVKLVAGDDYTASDGATVVLASAAALNDVVEVVAHFPRGLSDGYLKAEADARYPRVDTASQGLSSTAKTNAKTNRPPCCPASGSRRRCCWCPRCRIFESGWWPRWSSTPGSLKFKTSPLRPWASPARHSRGKLGGMRALAKAGSCCTCPP